MAEIKLTNGGIALVDDIDFVKLSKRNWYRDKDGYAYTTITYALYKHRNVPMHRVILSAKTGQIVDHKNHNKLDNRRENIRICSHAQNTRNAKARIGKSKYKGVGWLVGRWSARIQINKKRLYLGIFEKEEDAARAYDIEAKKQFGEYAVLNFP